MDATIDWSDFMEWNGNTQTNNTRMEHYPGEKHGGMVNFDNGTTIEAGQDAKNKMQTILSKR